MKKELIIKLVAALIGVIIAVIVALTEGVSVNTFAFDVLVSAMSVALALGMSTFIFPDVKFSVKTLVISIITSVLVFLVLGLFV